MTFSAPVAVSSQIVNEPVVRVDPTGIVYVGTTVGLPNHSPVFRSANDGASWTTLPYLAGTNFFGAEPDVAIAADGTVYVSDLYVGNLIVSKYTNHGQTLASTNVIGETSTGLDRQWIAVGEPALTGGHELWTNTNDVGRGIIQYYSPDGGLLPGTKPTPLAILQGDPGLPPVYDPISKNVYTPVTEGGVFEMAVTKSPPITVNAPKWRITAVADPNNQFPAAAVDKAGNVYAVWSQPTAGNNFDVFAAVSKDFAHTWKIVQLTNGGDNVYPWISAGAAGHMVAVWYGTPTSGDPEQNPGPWHVQVAQSLDMLSASPTFTVTTLPDVVQSGFGICLSGTACSLTATGNRALGDFFTVTVGPDGRTHIAYAKAVGGQNTRVYYVHQTGGAMT